MNKILFDVPGDPQGKARARTFPDKRTGHMRSITPEKTVLYENLIKTCFLQAAGSNRFNDETYLNVRIIAYYKIPTSASKIKQQRMLEGEILPDKKPDLDNIAKAILDALNGVAYRDDKQVINLQVKKLYGHSPKVSVLIEKI